MTYKIKRKTPNERELKVFREETKGKPTFKELAREGTRVVAQVPRKTHTKGEIVQYKEGLAKIKRVTPKGVYIQELKDTDKSDPFPELQKKEIFISDKEIQEGIIYPNYIFALT